MTRRSTRTVLLTGVTGNLGAFAAGRLLRRGDVVFALVRSREQPGLARRRALRSMAAVLPAPLSTEEHDRLCIVDADIS
ncbi:MAG TPA: SDR family oxidoreductase, partial [Vicinamibacterales bacterium]